MQTLRQIVRNAYRAAVEHSPFGRRILWRTVPATGVALTFDDGPNPEYTPRILDLLARYGAHATFFLVGEQVVQYPDLVRRMVTEGHAVGNHTFSHVHCRALDFSALRQEIERTDQALEVALGSNATSGLPWFRPPFGELRMAQALYLARAGRTLAFWNQDTRDYRGATAPEIAALGPRLAAGDIVLLHDRFPATVEALPALLDALREKGLPARALGPVGTCQPESFGSSPGTSLLGSRACR